jgi:pilus assembly protein CpaF
MTDKDLMEILDDVRDRVRNAIDINLEMNDDDFDELITKIVFEKGREIYLKPSEKYYLAQRVFNSMRRLDVIQPFIDDKEVTEIMVNGLEYIFIEKEGKIIKTKVKFESVESIENVVRNIVHKVNRSANELEAIVDARLLDGSRVSIVLPPIALNGPIITIRKFPEKPMTVEQLIKYGSITKDCGKYIENLVKAKYNIFISGGTGSGKTTFLNALSNFIPKDERVITIEDSAELQIKEIENLVKMETRNANSEKKGEVSIRDLIKASLRMRPERIIVGEVRGPEALDMLQAMNTGHDGSLSTGHANSTRDMLSRLETMVLSGIEIPLDAIRQQIASAIDIIIQLSRLRDKSRRTMEISEVVGYENGKIMLNPLFRFEEDGEEESGRIIGSLKRTENKVINDNKFKMAGIKEY